MFRKKEPEPPGPATWSEILSAYTKYAIDTAGDIAGTASQRFYTGVGPEKATGGTTSAKKLEEERKARKAAAKAKDEEAALMAKKRALEEKKKKNTGKSASSSSSPSSALSETLNKYSQKAQVTTGEGVARARELTASAGACAGALKNSALETSRDSTARLGDAIDRNDLPEHTAAAGLLALIVLLVLLVRWLYSRGSSKPATDSSKLSSSAVGATPAKTPINDPTTEQPAESSTSADAAGESPAPGGSSTSSPEGVKEPGGVDDASSAPSFENESDFAPAAPTTSDGGMVGGKDDSLTEGLPSSSSLLAPLPKEPSALTDSSLRERDAVGDDTTSNRVGVEFVAVDLQGDGGNGGGGGAGRSAAGLAFPGDVSIASDAATAGTSDVDVDARAAAMEEDEEEGTEQGEAEVEADAAGSVADGVAASMGMDTEEMAASDVVDDLKAGLKEELGVGDAIGASESVVGSSKAAEGAEEVNATSADNAGEAVRENRPEDSVGVPIAVEASTPVKAEEASDTAVTPTTAEKNEKKRRISFPSFPKSFRSKRDKTKGSATASAPLDDDATVATDDAGDQTESTAPSIEESAAPDEPSAQSTAVPPLVGVGDSLPASAPFVAEDPAALEAPTTPDNLYAPAVEPPTAPDRSRNDIVKVASFSSDEASAGLADKVATVTAGVLGAPPTTHDPVATPEVDFSASSRSGVAPVEPPVLPAAAGDFPGDNILQPPPTSVVGILTDNSTSSVVVPKIDDVQRPVDAEENSSSGGGGSDGAAEGEDTTVGSLETAVDKAVVAVTGTDNGPEIRPGAGLTRDAPIIEGVNDKVESMVEGVENRVSTAVEEVGSAVENATEKMQEAVAGEEKSEMAEEAVAQDAALIASSGQDVVTSLPALPAETEQEKLTADDAVGDGASAAPPASVAAAEPQPESSTPAPAAASVEGTTPSLLQSAPKPAADSTPDSLLQPAAADFGAVEVEEVEVVELYDQNEDRPSAAAANAGLEGAPDKDGLSASLPVVEGSSTAPEGDQSAPVSVGSMTSYEDAPGLSSGPSSVPKGETDISPLDSAQSGPGGSFFRRKKSNEEAAQISPVSGDAKEAPSNRKKIKKLMSLKSFRKKDTTK